MLISLNWLKDYIDLDVSVDDLCEKMTMLGLEIESVDRPGDEVQQVVVGEIESLEPHPNADKLVVCKTNVGAEAPLQIVCGATNMSVGDKVPTAQIGGSLPGGFNIGKRKMRGLESQGMMCSPKELGLGEDHDGLMILDKTLRIGDDVRPLLGLDDVVLEIEVTPNRGDWASMLGVARELSAAYGLPLKTPKITLKEDKQKAAPVSSVTLESADLCPRYIGRILTDVTIGPSPAWLAQRLIAAGQRPINNVVDITNYVLLETGQPLHAFDLDKLKGNRIIVRNAREGEKIETIDRETRTLTADMLTIADAQNAVAVAGVMGGFESEVGEGTRRIFLESAFFEPASIRRTSRALNLISEASQRFQRGADPDMAAYAADRASQLLQELAGATLLKGALDEYPKPLPQIKIQLRYARSDLLLGTPVPPETQRSILESLCFDSVKKDKTSVTVSVPSWRHDVTQEADLIEEIARLYGFDKMEESLPLIQRNSATFSPEYAPEQELRRYLASLGLTELISWTFTSAEDLEKSALAEPYNTMVPLQNPLSEKHAGMRPTLIPSLLNAASSNLRKNRGSVLAFEIGPIYRPQPEAELPSQKPTLGIVLSGTAAPAHWDSDPRPVDFYDLKGYVEALAERLNLKTVYEPCQVPTFDPTESATMRKNKREIAHFGRVSTKVQKAYDIEQPVYLLELDLDALLHQTTEPPQFQDITAFPPSLRDLAVIVDTSVQAGDIRQTALNAGGRFLASVELFDVYTGEQIPVGKKSLALGLTFQSTEQTLTDKVTQKACDKIVRKLKDTYGAELR